MSRFILAFRCFFALLFLGKLPPRATEYLPEGARPVLPEGAEEAEEGAKEPEKAAKEPKKQPEAAKEPEKAAREPEKQPEAAKEPEKQPARPAQPARKAAVAAAEQHEQGALALLALMQREGRLVDFLQESLDDYDDGDIGASVRDIHRGLKKVLSEHLDIEPVMPGEEDDPVSVPKGFDPGEVRLIGDVDGEPPFEGVLRHHGWRVTKANLPTLSEGVDRHVLAPAEVEVS